LIAGWIVYDAMTGRVFLRTGYFILALDAPVMIGIAAFLVTLALYDLYHRIFA
jgi:hypothetical protein